MRAREKKPLPLSGPDPKGREPKASRGRRAVKRYLRFGPSLPQAMAPRVVGATTTAY